MDLNKYITYFSNKDEVFGKPIIKEGQMPFIDYSNIVTEFIMEFYESEFVDKDYVNSIESFDIEDQSSWDELWKLKAMLTYIIRGDRFSTGMLLNSIENGTVLYILIQINKLI